MLGSTKLHAPHAFVSSRGFCVSLRYLACASQAPCKLALGCAGRPSELPRYGKELLARIVGGKTLRSWLAWPRPSEAVAWCLFKSRAPA